MKRLGMLIAFFGLLLIVLPSITAQDGKKDPDKVRRFVAAAHAAEQER